MPAGLLRRPGTSILRHGLTPRCDTRLLRQRRAPPGCATVGSLEMLLAQAVAQFETWTGLEAPLDVMKSAALFLAQEQEA